MSESPKVETRGRPRKNTEERLPAISRQLFSEHCAVFYACCMVYVLEVFLKTKTEKRIGHSEGGFTLYEKISPAYCFDSLDQDLREWGHAPLLADHPSLAHFIRTINGCAPRFVFREVVSLVMGLAEALLDAEVGRSDQLDLGQVPLLALPEVELNRRFKYLRFSPIALRQLKMDKWATEVSRKIRQLWRPFLKIVCYTVLGVLRGSEKSKYLKPFFSDAEHPEETIIGQLNLQQIVLEQERQERPMPSTPAQGFTKIVQTECEREDEPRFEFTPQPLSDRPMVQHRRPITLITFPSSSHIDSPTSPFRSKPDELPKEEIDHQVPQKMRKEE